MSALDEGPILGHLFPGGGQIGELMRSFDWSKTKLGPLESWPRSLIGYVRMVMELPTPAIIFWGEDQTQLYNEGYAVIMGPRHPKYFGASYRECWPDTYPLIYPWMRKVLDKGEVIRVDKEHITVTRHGFPEEAFFTFTFSPLRDDSGAIAGIFQPVIEVTDAVLSERRAETLRALGPRPDSPDPARDAIEALSANNKDVPFALVYLWDEPRRRLGLAARTGNLHGNETSFAKLEEAARRVFESNASLKIDNADELLGDMAGVGPWPEPSRSVLILPLSGSKIGEPLGVIVYGISPRLHFNDQYRRFLELAARQVATAITTTRLADAAENERRSLHSLFTNAPAVIAIVKGPEYVFELANPLYLQLIGHRDVIGKRLTEAVPELIGQGFIELLDEVRRTGKPFVGKEVPTRLDRNANGKLEDVFMNFVYQPRFGLHGEVEAIMAFGFEVTDQVIARRKIEEAERRAVLVAEAVPVLVWTSGPQGKPDFYNQRWYEYTGIPPGTIDPEAWKRLAHPEDLSTISERWARSLATGEPYEATVRLLRASDHSYRWHLARSFPLKDHRGAVLKWVGSSTDIDDQKRAEENTRFLAEASATLTTSLDYEETLKRVAQLCVPRLADWCAIYLVEPGDAAPRRLALMHRHPEKVKWADELNRRYPMDPAAQHGVPQVIRTGKPEFFAHIPDELLVGAANDAEHLRILREVGMRSVMTLPLVARGRVLGAITFVTAESGRMYSEADVAVAQELADRAATAVDNARLYNESQEAIRVRDDFLSIASHELKTPLTPLQLHIQALQQSVIGEGRELSTQRVAAKLDTISRQVDRLEKLVNSLLDISRITGQRLHVEREQVDLSQIVQEAKVRFSEELKKAGCSLELSTPESVVGSWDKLRLEQIVSNLISNAIKFGAGKPIHVSVSTQNGWARLTVRDRGIGIAPEDQARIFERFERAVLTRHYGGFGLGLWITRQIVEAHGGTIEVKSELGHGSIFTVALPLSATNLKSGLPDTSPGGSIRGNTLPETSS